MTRLLRKIVTQTSRELARAAGRFCKSWCARVTLPADVATANSGHAAARGFSAPTSASACSSDGHEVVCLDNFFTGTRANVEHLLDNHRFELVRHDVTEPLTLEVDQVFHLACPASPIHYQRNPVRTIRTAVQGTLNMLDLAREAHARILIASTSEVYGDPDRAPAARELLGQRQPDRAARLLRRGQALRRGAGRVVRHASIGVEVRIARIFNTYGPRMHENDGRVVSNFIVQALRGRAHHRLRRGAADAVVLLRRPI